MMTTSQPVRHRFTGTADVERLGGLGAPPPTGHRGARALDRMRALARAAAFGPGPIGVAGSFGVVRSITTALDRPGGAGRI